MSPFLLFSLPDCHSDRPSILFAAGVHLVLFVPVLAALEQAKTNPVLSRLLAPTLGSWTGTCITRNRRPISFTETLRDHDSWPDNVDPVDA